MNSYSYYKTDYSNNISYYNFNKNNNINNNNNLHKNAFTNIYNNINNNPYNTSYNYKRANTFQTNYNNIIHNNNLNNTLKGIYDNSYNKIINNNSSNSISNDSTYIIYNNNSINNINQNYNNGIISNSNIYTYMNNNIVHNNIYENKIFNSNINNYNPAQYNHSKTQIITQPTSLTLENKEEEIDKTVINIVLKNTIEQYFVLKDFFKLKNEKDILNYFYLKEKICLEWLNKNYTKEDKSKKFLKKMILNTIQQIYENIEEFSKIRKSIKSKINKIIDDIETKKTFCNLKNIYKKVFEVDNIPIFLSNEIYKTIENILYLEKYNKNFEQMNNIYELEQMLGYYYGFIRGDMQPFNISYIGSNNEDLFMIMLYSNLKDIYISKKLQKIFLDNYNNMIKCFSLYNFDSNKFYNILNKSKLTGKENELLNKHFNNYKKIQNLHNVLYVLCSYYYLVMNVMRDTSDNYNIGAFMNIENKNVEINLNNAILGKILKNIINNFVKYSPCDKLNCNVYQYLINFLSIYIFKEDNKISKEQNKIYEISDIFNSVNKSSLPDIKIQTIQSYFSKLNKVESSNISLSKFLTKIKELFTEEVHQEMEINKINLTPLNLKRNSNLITIFISGFGSECENIYSWRNFIDFEPKFSSFYFFKWPSGNFAEMISFIPFSEKFVLEIPQKFMNNKLKAKLVGKILGLFLVSNEDFKKCQINLVGFSLGCHVIKYCIKEIAKIKRVRNMINNVLFMGGATYIKDIKNWKNNLKKVVGGRIINCFSEHDFVLDKLFKLCVTHTAIGTRELILKDENSGYNIVENYNLSDLKLGHLDYRKNFGKILKRINFY